MQTGHPSVYGSGNMFFDSRDRRQLCPRQDPGTQIWNPESYSIPLLLINAPGLPGPHQPWTLVWLPLFLRLPSPQTLKP